jgi:hypothetical protein
MNTNRLEAMRTQTEEMIAKKNQLKAAMALAETQASYAILLSPQSPTAGQNLPQGPQTPSRRLFVDPVTDLSSPGRDQLQILQQLTEAIKEGFQSPNKANTSVGINKDRRANLNAITFLWDEPFGAAQALLQTECLAIEGNYMPCVSFLTGKRGVPAQNKLTLHAHSTIINKEQWNSICNAMMADQFQDNFAKIHFLIPNVTQTMLESVEAFVIRFAAAAEACCWVSALSNASIDHRSTAWPLSEHVVYLQRGLREPMRSDVYKGAAMNPTLNNNYTQLKNFILQVYGAHSQLTQQQPIPLYVPEHAAPAQDIAIVRCYACDAMGHYASECPNRSGKGYGGKGYGGKGGGGKGYGGSYYGGTTYDGKGKGGSRYRDYGQGSATLQPTDFRQDQHRHRRSNRHDEREQRPRPATDGSGRDNLKRPRTETSKRSSGKA